MGVYISRKITDSSGREEEMAETRLKPCPICGAKAFVSRDVVDGFYFGWSVGCPRACIADGIHGYDDYNSFKKARLVMFCFDSKEQAIEAWNSRVTESESE